MGKQNGQKSLSLQPNKNGKKNGQSRPIELIVIDEEEDSMSGQDQEILEKSQINGQNLNVGQGIVKDQVNGQRSTKTQTNGQNLSVGQGQEIVKKNQIDGQSQGIAKKSQVNGQNLSVKQGIAEKNQIDGQNLSVSQDQRIARKDQDQGIARRSQTNNGSLSVVQTQRIARKSQANGQNLSLGQGTAKSQGISQNLSFNQYQTLDESAMLSENLIIDESSRPNPHQNPSSSNQSIQVQPIFESTAIDQSQILNELSMLSGDLLIDESGQQTSKPPVSIRNQQILSFPTVPHQTPRLNTLSQSLNETSMLSGNLIIDESSQQVPDQSTTKSQQTLNETSMLSGNLIIDEDSQSNLYITANQTQLEDGNKSQGQLDIDQNLSQSTIKNNQNCPNQQVSGNNPTDLSTRPFQQIINYFDESLINLSTELLQPNIDNLSTESSQQNINDQNPTDLPTELFQQNPTDLPTEPSQQNINNQNSIDSPAKPTSSQENRFIHEYISDLNIREQRILAYKKTLSQQITDSQERFEHENNPNSQICLSTGDHRMSVRNKELNDQESQGEFTILREFNDQESLESQGEFSILREFNNQSELILILKISLMVY